MAAILTAQVMTAAVQNRNRQVETFSQSHVSEQNKTSVAATDRAAVLATLQ